MVALINNLQQKHNLPLSEIITKTGLTEPNIKILQNRAKQVPVKFKQMIVLCDDGEEAIIRDAIETHRVRHNNNNNNNNKDKIYQRDGTILAEILLE